MVCLFLSHQHGYTIMATRFYADFQPVGQDEPTLYHGTVDEDLIVWDDENVPKYVVDKTNMFLECEWGFEPIGTRLALAIGIGITKAE